MKQSRVEILADMAEFYMNVAAGCKFEPIYDITKLIDAEMTRIAQDDMHNPAAQRYWDALYDLHSGYYFWRLMPGFDIIDIRLHESGYFRAKHRGEGTCSIRSSIFEHVTHD